MEKKNTNAQHLIGAGTTSKVVDPCVSTLSHSTHVEEKTWGYNLITCVVPLLPSSPQKRHYGNFVSNSLLWIAALNVVPHVTVHNCTYQAHESIFTRRFAFLPIGCLGDSFGRKRLNQWNHMLSKSTENDNVNLIGWSLCQRKNVRDVCVCFLYLNSSSKNVVHSN